MSGGAPVIRSPHKAPALLLRKRVLDASELHCHFELFLSVVVGTISYLICLVLFKDTEIAPFVRKCVSSIKWHAF